MRMMVDANLYSGRVFEIDTSGIQRNWLLRCPETPETILDRTK